MKKQILSKVSHRVSGMQDEHLFADEMQHGGKMAGGGISLKSYLDFFV